MWTLYLVYFLVSYCFMLNVSEIYNYSALYIIYAMFYAYVYK